MPLHATSTVDFLSSSSANFIETHSESQNHRFSSVAVHVLTYPLMTWNKNVCIFFYKAVSFYIFEGCYCIPSQSIIQGACEWPQVIQTSSSYFPPQGFFQLILLFLMCDAEIQIRYAAWRVNSTEYRGGLTSSIFIGNTSSYTVEYTTFAAICTSEDAELPNLRLDLTLSKTRLKKTYPHTLKGLSIFQRADLLMLSTW